MSFGTFVDAAARAIYVHDHKITSSDHPLLNGVPHRTYRQTISLSERRRAGAFFSGPTIGRRLVDQLTSAVRPDARVMDPTCGMGDLLLAYAAKLPLKVTLALTVRSWGECLAGLDLEPDLIRLAKVRLILLAQARGGFTEGAPDLKTAFPLIQVGDALRSDQDLKQADAFLFNPPFGLMAEPEEGLSWSSGRINAAALFLDTLVRAKRPEAPIAAVLPEVLRCGTRYARFRTYLRASGMSGAFETFGRFDAWTDVDVFISLLQPNEDPVLWAAGEAEVGDAIGGLCSVRVGTVVPHRHPETGPRRLFICAKTTPAWAQDFLPTASRLFSGSVFQPPFVAVRRTSSPSDRHRAVGAIVVGNEPIAVENHLLVLRPDTGEEADCRRLLASLHDPRTSAYLNQHIRCRHLTVSSVRAIPLYSDV